MENVNLNFNTTKLDDIIPLYNDICDIIDNERNKIAVYINAKICLTNWHIGKRINDEILFNRRADYGQQIVRKLSQKLTERYGKGWSEKKLRHCLRSAETFSEDEIITATQKQLSWTHLKTLMLNDNPNIKVAQYYTKLPDKKVLSEKLKKAIAIAKEHCHNKHSDK